MKAQDVNIHLGRKGDDEKFVFFKVGQKIPRSADPKDGDDTVVAIIVRPFLKRVTIVYDNGVKVFYRRYNFIYSTK